MRSHPGKDIRADYILLLSLNFCISQFLTILEFLLLLVKERVVRRLVLSAFFTGYPENTKYPPDKNCVSCSSHKIVRKLAYLGVKMMSLNQKHKTVMSVANLGVSKLHISFKGIKSSGKLPISV